MKALTTSASTVRTPPRRASTLDRFYHDVLGLQFFERPSPWFEGGAGQGGPVFPGALRQVACCSGTRRSSSWSTRPASETTGRSRRTARSLPRRPFSSTTSRRRGRARAKASSSTARSPGTTRACSPAWRWVYFEDPDATPSTVEVAYYTRRSGERNRGVSRVARVELWQARANLTKEPPCPSTPCRHGSKPTPRLSTLSSPRSAPRRELAGVPATRITSSRPRGRQVWSPSARLGRGHAHGVGRPSRR